jgi:hypothetical protein
MPLPMAGKSFLVFSWASAQALRWQLVLPRSVSVYASALIFVYTDNKMPDLRYVLPRRAWAFHGLLCIGHH